MVDRLGTHKRVAQQSPTVVHAIKEFMPQNRWCEAQANGPSLPIWLASGNVGVGKDRDTLARFRRGCELDELDFSKDLRDRCFIHSEQESVITHAAVRPAMYSEVLAPCTIVEDSK